MLFEGTFVYKNPPADITSQHIMIIGSFKFLKTPFENVLGIFSMVGIYEIFGHA